MLDSFGRRVRYRGLPSGSCFALLILTVSTVQSVIQSGSPVGQDALSESQEKTFATLDSQMLVKLENPAQQQLAMTGDDGDIPDWKEEGYEPYSDELDSFVTTNGMPDPLDDDSVTHQRYATWLQNYKRVPNEPKVLWSYDNADSSPDVWSSLDKKFMMCDADLTKGAASPIDIQTSRSDKRCFGPSFKYQRPEWNAEQSILTEMFDRSFIVNVANCDPKDGCQAAPLVSPINEQSEMILDRIIFHTPSEHKLNGETFDMELQFMHCRTGGTLTADCRPEMAVAVFVKDGGTTQKSPDFINNLAMTIKEVGPDPKELAKGLKFQSISDVINPLLDEFYLYEGSTTYPPCYQGVKWYIPTKAISVSSSAIAAFKKREGENVRPTFALGTRPLYLLTPESADHWTYRGPRGAENWGTSRFPILAYSSCGVNSDCERLPNQELRDACLADQAIQSPVDIYTNICSRYFEENKPCVKESGLVPFGWNRGQSWGQPMKIYLKDCGPCQPCNNKYNSYTLALSVPGSKVPVSLVPGYGGCENLETCKRLTGYDSPTVAFKNSIYAVKEIVFHTPSEHTFDGQKFDMEVQLVADLIDCVKCTCSGWGTKNYNGAQWCCCQPNNADHPTLIQSILFAQQGRGSLEWVSKIASLAPSVTGEAMVLDDALLFQRIAGDMNNWMHKYIHYSGSLTTPPCTSKVQWIVVHDIQNIDAEELKAIASLSVGGNARRVQPLNKRVLTIAEVV